MSLERERGRGGFEMIPFFSWRNAWECLLGAIGIYILGLAALHLLKISGTLAVPLWPSSGLALALVLLRGWRLFPAISLGTIAATQTFGSPILFSITGSLGNTLESLISWFLMTQAFDFSNQMRRVRDTWQLLLIGAPTGTALNSVICTWGLAASGVITTSGTPLSLLCFWIGNILGIIVFTPLLLTLGQRLPLKSEKGGPVSALLVFGLLILVVLLGFWNHSTAHTGLIPIGYLSFPILVWMALTMRFGVTLAIPLVTMLVVGFTTLGYGPLVRYFPMATYSELAVFISIISITCLIIMSLEEERALITMKKRLAISAGRLGQWEWSLEKGVTFLDFPEIVCGDHEQHSAMSEKRFMDLLNPSDRKNLPWLRSSEGMQQGAVITSEVQLGGIADHGTHPPEFLQLSGRVMEIDHTGRVTSMLGILREITSERNATDLRISTARRESELLNLRALLHPRFLFNSLNIVKRLVAEDQEKAEHAIVSLSEVLDSSLTASRQQYVPLSTEIAVMENYIRLQKLCFDNQLITIINVDTLAEEVMVPPLILSQLVENAIKHGSWSRTMGLDITVTAMLTGPDLIIKVSNPGVIQDLKINGMGIQSVRKQLDLLFGTDASFDICNNPGHRIVSEVRIPSNPNGGMNSSPARTTR